MGVLDIFSAANNNTSLPTGSFDGSGAFWWPRCMGPVGRRGYGRDCIEGVYPITHVSV
jgi:hypothetical protein